MKPIRSLRILFAGIAISLVAGCASAPSGPSLYVLDTGDRPDRSTVADTSAPVVVVDTVRVAPPLDENGIVYQTAAHRVAIANDNRWAAPLAGQLTDSLVNTLSAALPNARVVQNERISDPALRITPRVEAFMGHYDGEARIAGQWRIESTTDEPPLTRHFERRVPLTRDGYDALVESLSEGWRAEGRRLAEMIAAQLDASATGRAGR